MTASAVPVVWTSYDGLGSANPPEWCRAVGPSLVRTDTSQASAPVDALVVASWNIRAGAGDLLEFVELLRNGAFTGQPQPAFVILLQEAYRVGPEVPVLDGANELTSRIDIPPPSGQRADIAELARLLDLHVYYTPSMPNGTAGRDQPGEDRGNAILSTLPLEDLAAVELPFEVQRRVAVAATVSGITASGTPWTLRVASGHLDTRSRWSRFVDSFGAGRARQARALGEHLHGDAIVLGADLNTWSAGFLERAVDILYARFPESPQLTGSTFLAAGVIPRRLDHFLARLPRGYHAEVRRVHTRFGSDHYPLVGIVRFTASESIAGQAEGRQPADVPRGISLAPALSYVRPHSS